MEELPQFAYVRAGPLTITACVVIYAVYTVLRMLLWALIILAAALFVVVSSLHHHYTRLNDHQAEVSE